MSRTLRTNIFPSYTMLAVFVLALLAVTVASPAGASGTSAPGQDSGTCVPIGDDEWFCEGQEGADPGDSTSGGTTPVKGNAPACREGDKDVPCRDRDGGVWNGRCYATVMDPPPVKTDLIWKGHDKGVIMTCVLRIAACDQAAGIHLPAEDCVLRWWAPVPEGTVDVEQIARDAFARANPTEIPIGIVPENEPGSIGLVGMPVWMWVENPGTQTTGPLTATAPAGSATVTSTGRVTSIDWDMGDGTTITCQGTGTVYQDSFGVKDSPDCGHRYDKQGNPYTITATSHWVVEWEGAGQPGRFTLDRTNETQIVVGEAHVITQ